MLEPRLRPTCWAMGVASGFWSWSNDFSRECLALVADRSLSGGRVTRELYAVSATPVRRSCASRWSASASTAASRTSGQLASLNRCVEYLSARLEGAEFRRDISTCPLTWVNAGDLLRPLSRKC